MVHPGDGVCAVRRVKARRRTAPLGDAALRQGQAFARAASNRALIATRQAGRAFKHGDCPRAGKFIDQAWVAVGEGKAYLHAVGMSTHPVLYRAYLKLQSIDRLFEARCVRRTPA